MERHLKWLVVVAALFVLAACASEERAYGDYEGVDPASLRELSGLGGASYEDLSLESVAQASDMVVEAEVIDIRPSRFNTDDGRFPQLGDLASRGLSGLELLTEIEVRIFDTWDNTSDLGDSIVVTVGGGLYETTLDPDRANAIGMTDPGDGHESEGAHEELPVTEPASFTYGSTPEEDLEEGDHVIVFLSSVTIPGYADAGDLLILAITHPAGILFASDDDSWRAGRYSTTTVDPLPLVQLVPSGN